MTKSIARDRLVDLLERVRGKRIVVVGDAMLDVYLSGDVERVSPEAPVPIVRVRERKYALGGAANVAQNVVAIGADCDLVAVVGRDSAGERLRAMLEQITGRTTSIVSVARCTTQKTRILGRSQQLLRVDEEDDAELGGSEMQRIIEAVRDAIASADAVVLEDYNKGVLTPSVIRTAIETARARELPIIVDPKFRNFFGFGGATIFKPNRRELEAALGAAFDLEHPDAVPETLERLGVAHILLTLGERGMALFSADGEIARVPTVAREVYDVVGAGDTVTAYLAVALAAGATPIDAAVVANIAAGIEVGKLGAATVSSAELLEYVDAHALHM
jgi:rfaE bifunctional protein kinase chain/domain